MKQVIAIGGQPGCGKTTLMKKFIAMYEWEQVEPMKMLPALYCKELDLYILGKYEDGETFAGTDRLSMGVQPVAKAFVEETQSNILFEGDRLFNQSFLEFLSTQKDVTLNAVYIEADEGVLLQRYKDRGSDQTETFLKGRRTKYANITSNLDLIEFITKFQNNDLSDQEKIMEFVLSKTLDT